MRTAPLRCAAKCALLCNAWYCLPRFGVRGRPLQHLVRAAEAVHLRFSPVGHGLDSTLAIRHRTVVLTAQLVSLVDASLRAPGPCRCWMGFQLLCKIEGCLVPPITSGHKTEATKKASKSLATVPGATSIRPLPSIELYCTRNIHSLA